MGDGCIIEHYQNQRYTYQDTGTYTLSATATFDSSMEVQQQLIQLLLIQCS